MINVPTVVFIDEAGRIARPNAMEYGTDMFKQFHGRESAPFLAAVRSWALRSVCDVPPEQVAKRSVPPTPDEELARAEFTLAWFLHKRGRVESAERHFVRAGELSPNDWTIRRGSMPIRGKNPMGPEFFELFREWEANGKPTYERLARERNG
jgi:hypothetical protein